MRMLKNVTMVVVSMFLCAGGVASALAQESLIVEGEICYKVKKDDSSEMNKTDLEVEDEGGAKRVVRVKTQKALFVCDRALINLNALQ